MHKYEEVLKKEAKDKLEREKRDSEARRCQLVVVYEQMQDEVRKKHGSNTMMQALSSIPDNTSCRMLVVSMPSSPRSDGSVHAGKPPSPQPAVQFTPAELFLRVQAMQKEGKKAGPASAGGICTKEHAEKVARQLAALHSKMQPPADGSTPVVERELTRHGNPKRKKKLTMEQKSDIVEARRLKSETVYDEKVAASKKREARIARNKQIRQNAEAKRAVDAKHAAAAKRAAKAPD